MDLLWFLIIGALAGAIAGNIMRGRGFGCLGNIVVGIIGAFVGGFLLTLLGFTARGSLANLVSATLGAMILLAVFGVGQRRR